MKKEPVGILAAMGVTIAVIVSAQLEGTALEPYSAEIAVAIVGMIAALARQYVVPHVPEELLETFERLSVGTDMEDAVVVPKHRHDSLLESENQLRIVNGRQREADNLSRE